MTIQLSHTIKAFAYTIAAATIANVALASCSNGKTHEGMTIVIEKESFFPQGLPTINAYSSRLFCFCSDSIGFAVSPLPLKKEQNYEQRFTVSRTADRGYTWKKECTGKGTCLEIAECEGKIFLLTKARKKGALEDSVCIWRTSQAKFRPKAILKTTAEVYGFHAFDEHTYVCLKHRSEDRISYLLTTDGGKNWETHDLPGMTYDKQVSYSGNYMLIPLMGGLYLRDIVSNEENFFKLRNFMTGFIAGKIVVSQDMKAWEYDGKSLRNIAEIKDDEFHIHTPKFLTPGNGIFVGLGSGAKGKSKNTNEDCWSSCLFFSTDRGYNWDIIKTEKRIKEIAALKCDEGASVIYTQENDRMLHFMRISTCKKEQHRKRAGKKLKPSKNIPDSLDAGILFNLLFGQLIDFYEDNVPGFKMPEMNDAAQQHEQK